MRAGKLEPKVEHPREEHSWCCQLGDSQARNTTSGDKRQIAAIMHLRHLKWLLIGQRRFCEVYQYGQWQSATNNAPSPQS